MGTLDANPQKYLQAELASVSQSVKTIIAEIERINAVLVAHGIT
jgi:hypothetical protein